MSDVMVPETATRLNTHGPVISQLICKCLRWIHEGEHSKITFNKNSDERRHTSVLCGGGC